MPGMGTVVHHPEALLDEMTLQRRILAEIRNDLFEHVGVEDRALHVLRARIFAALELQHLEAARGHACSAAALPAMPAPMTIASNFSSIMAVSIHPTASGAVCFTAGEPVALMGRQALAEGFRQRRQQPDGVGRRCRHARNRRSARSCRC